MALTRKMLKAMGIEDDQAEQIIEAHAETVSALKQQRDDAQAKADGVPELEKQLEAAKKAAEAAAADDSGAKLKAVQEEFEAYKADVEKRESAATAERLFRAALKEASLSPDYHDLIVSGTDLSKFAVKDGAFEDQKAVDKAVSDIAGKYPQFVTKTSTQGANVGHPPAAGGGAVTKEQFARMSLRERNDLYKSDRATYDSLVGNNAKEQK